MNIKKLLWVMPATLSFVFIGYIVYASIAYVFLGIGDFNTLTRVFVASLLGISLFIPVVIFYTPTEKK